MMYKESEFKSGLIGRKANARFVSLRGCVRFLVSLNLHLVDRSILDSWRSDENPTKLIKNIILKTSHQPHRSEGRSAGPQLPKQERRSSNAKEETYEIKKAMKTLHDQYFKEINL